MAARALVATLGVLLALVTASGEELKLSQVQRRAGEGRLGQAIAVEGDVVVAGAPLDGRGAALVMKMQSLAKGEAWLETVAVLGGEAAGPSGFGEAVAVNGKWIAVAAGASNSSAASAVYMFRTPLALAQDAPLAPAQVLRSSGNGQDGNGFGHALALGPKSLFVGTPRDSRVQQFNLNDEGRWEATWDLERREGDSRTGEALALWGTTLAVSKVRGAAACVDLFDIGAENRKPERIEELCDADQLVGVSIWPLAVALHESKVALGNPNAPLRAPASSGTLTLWERGPADEAWERVEVENPARDLDTWRGTDAFGAALAFDVSGNRLAVGAPEAEIVQETTTIALAGAIYIFERSNDAEDWVERGQARALLANLRSSLGQSVSFVTDDLLVAGQPGRQGTLGGVLLFEVLPRWDVLAMVLIGVPLGLAGLLSACGPESWNLVALIIIVVTTDAVRLWYGLVFLDSDLFRLSGQFAVTFLGLSVVLNLAAATHVTWRIYKRNDDFAFWVADNRYWFLPVLVLLGPFTGGIVRIAWSGLGPALFAPISLEDELDAADMGKIRVLVADIPQFVIVLVTAYLGNANFFLTGGTVEVMSIVASVHALVCARSSLVMLDLPDDVVSRSDESVSASSSHGTEDPEAFPELEDSRRRSSRLQVWTPWRRPSRARQTSPPATFSAAVEPEL